MTSLNRTTQPSLFLMLLAVCCGLALLLARPAAAQGQQQPQRADTFSVGPATASGVVVPEGYRVEVFADGLTYPGDATFGPDGKMYFVISTQGNSGTVEGHLIRAMKIFEKPDTREIPCEDVEVTGIPFFLDNALTDAPDDTVRAEVYAELGRAPSMARPSKGSSGATAPPTAPTPTAPTLSALPGVCARSTATTSTQTAASSARKTRATSWSRARA